jgi:hypothetical protein
MGGHCVSKYIRAAILLILCVSCGRDIHTIETRPLSHKNPTSYVFPVPVPEARERVLAALKDDGLMQDLQASFPMAPHSYFVAESREHAVFSERVFADPANRDDVYLHSYGTPVCLSPVYHGGGVPLRYVAAFQLHLVAAGDGGTRVSVVTHDPKVINGSKCCGLHGYAANTVAVEPTTIEEYKILLFLGRALGEGDMPPLRLPEAK